MLADRLSHFFTFPIILMYINSFLHRLFLDHVRHHFLFLDSIKKIKKKLSKIRNISENIMENGA